IHSLKSRCAHSFSKAFDGKRSDSVDEWRQRRVVSIGPNILGYVFAMRAPPLAAGDRPLNLRPVHSVGSGEPAELMEMENDSRATMPSTTAPCLTQTTSRPASSCVDRALNELFATRHLTSASSWPWFLFPWRSFH